MILIEEVDNEPEAIEKYLSFGQMIEHLTGGWVRQIPAARAKRKTWVHSYVEYSFDNVLVVNHGSSISYYWNPTQVEILAKDWEIIR